MTSRSTEIAVVPEHPPNWDAYATVSIAFNVREVLDVGAAPDHSDGLVLRRRAVTAPYIKDYDRVGGGIQRWSQLYEETRWAVFAAFTANSIKARIRVGGAVVTIDPLVLDVVSDVDDVAYLWDIRVAPAWRGRGVGHALFDAAVQWAQTRGCRELRIETQNVNIAACDFYRRQGCSIAHVDTAAYTELPDEIRLIYSKRLDTP